MIETKFVLSAIYGRNLNHKILADITMLGESFAAQILARYLQSSTPSNCHHNVAYDHLNYFIILCK